MPFGLPELPYADDVREPHSDAKTMEIHSTRHHQSGVNNLNTGLDDTEYTQRVQESLVAEVESLPGNLRAQVCHTGGGHADPELFWSVMPPQAGGQQGGELAQAIDAELGGSASFRETFTKAALTRFGSARVWLSADGQGQPTMESSANQDHPFMRGIAFGSTAIPGRDVWEHACCLRYQNRRPEYIAAIYNHINWNEAARCCAAARTKGSRL